MWLRTYFGLLKTLGDLASSKETALSSERFIGFIFFFCLTIALFIIRLFVLFNGFIILGSNQNDIHWQQNNKWDLHNQSDHLSSNIRIKAVSVGAWNQENSKYNHKWLMSNSSCLSVATLDLASQDKYYQRYYLQNDWSWYQEKSFLFIEK